jgi:hypothetical protein
MSFFSRKKHPSASQLAPQVTVTQTPSQALSQLSKDPQAQQQQQQQQSVRDQSVFLFFI